MKGRKQKISQDTCLQRDRAEPEVYAGGQTYIGITENNFTNADQQSYGLLEQILFPTNLNQAYKQVKGNKGSGGIDKMEVEFLKDYLVRNKEELIQSIMGGTYRPNAVRRVEIPKAHPRSIIRMKERIKTLTSRSNGWGDARRKEELRQYIRRNWVGKVCLNLNLLMTHLTD